MSANAIQLAETIQSELAHINEPTPDLRTQVDLGKDVWVGPFATYRELVKDCTEAPDSIHWGALACCIATCLGRSVYIRFPTPVYTNQSVVVVGDSGVMKKSTAINLARKCTALASETVIHGVSSAEALIERMGEVKGPCLYVADELRMITANAKRQGTANFLPFLNTAFDCSDVLELSKAGQKRRVDNPFLSMLTACPPGWMRGEFGCGDIAGGVINRFLFITGAPKRPMAFPEPPDEQAMQHVRQDIAKAVTWAHEQPREMQFDSQAREVWKSFYNQWWPYHQALDQVERDLTARVPTHCIKVAVLYAALRQSECISPCDLAAGISVAKAAQQTVLGVFEQIQRNGMSEHESLILKQLQKHGVCMKRRDLRQNLKHKMDAMTLDRALNALQRNGVVMLFNQRNSSGPETPMVSLIGGGH